MGVTGTRSSRGRLYNWHGWVLLLVVGVTKCVDDDDANAGFNKMIFLVVVSSFGGFPKQPPIARSKTIQMNEYLN
jgi:hypothetical protein